MHLDEFDKLATHTDREKNINGIGIQQSLLKPLDSFTLNFTVQDISRLRPVTSANLKTDNLIFIFTRSFNSTAISSPEDLIKANFLPKLAYRIAFYLHLEESNYNELLVNIHSEGLLEKATTFAAKYGLNISFKDNFEKNEHNLLG
nr:AAA family ATPase [Bartonella sp. DB5-6]